MIKRHIPLIFIYTLFVLAFGSCKKEGVLEASDTNSILKNELKSLVNQVKLWHDSTVRSKTTTNVTSQSITANYGNYILVNELAGLFNFRAGIS